MSKLVKLTSKNQLTLPADVVRNHPGITYFEVHDSAEALTLYPVKAQREESALDRARKQFKAKGFSEETIAEAVAWARSKRR